MWHPTTIPPTIAVFNGDTAVLERFQHEFERAGVRAVAAHAAELESGEEAVAFLRRHGARAVVYELPPPSERGWTVFQRLYRAAQAVGSPFVVSTIAELADVDGSGSDDTNAQVAGTVRMVCRLVSAGAPPDA